jgi:hypothetical protein
MSFLRNITTGLRSLFRKEQVDRELDEELRAYQEMAADEKMKDGMSRKEALRTVRLERGSLELTKEIVRSAGWESFVQTCWHDLRFAARMLRKTPGFAAVAVLTLTLGIGATASVFSVVDAVLLRRLPYLSANRLVSLYEDRTSTGFHRRQFTPANFADCQAQTTIFEDVAAIDADRVYNLTGNGGTPERLSAEGVTHNLFSILGIQPMVGRLFLPEEDAAGSEHVALLSHRLWLSRFGGDRNVLGQAILLNGEKYSVVGVMPPWFSFPNKDADLWVPTAFTPQQLADRGAHFLTVVGALQPGVSVSQANAELRVLSQNLRQQHIDIMRFVDRFVAVPLQEVYTEDVRGGLIVLLVAVAFILLIACSNVANLLLSRATVRQREIALRSALGAGRGRIVRQLLTESVVLATAGGVLGLLLTKANFSFLKTLIPEDLSRTISLTLNFSVLGFAVFVSFASTFLFGLTPAPPREKEILLLRCTTIWRTTAKQKPRVGIWSLDVEELTTLAGRPSLSISNRVGLRIGSTFGRFSAMTCYIAVTMPKYKVGERVRVKLSGGRIVDAIVKAVIDRTDGTRYQVSSGDETAFVRSWRIVEPKNAKARHAEVPIAIFLCVLDRKP